MEEASRGQDDGQDAAWAYAPSHRALPTPTPWGASLPFSAVRISRVHLQSWVQTGLLPVAAALYPHAEIAQHEPVPAHVASDR